MSEQYDVIGHHTSERDSAEHGAVQTVGTAPPAGPGATRVDREFTGKERSASRMVIRRFLRHRLAAVSLVLFWPAAFMIRGNGESAAELGRLKGEMQAIEQANIQKNCGINFRRG